MIAIADYGLGNVQAIANIYKRKNVPAAIATNEAGLLAGDRVILPGVGSFDHAMKRLDDSGMRDALEHMARVRKVPVLGICVGMQMLAERSEEGRRPGLGWIAGEVKRFDVTRFSQQTPLPHMGWNGVRPLASTGLFENLGPDSEFYFLHSYYFAPAEEEFILSLTDYGGGFASSVSSGNIFGVQFHPEKSHGWGIQLLLNFGSIRPCCVQE